MIGTIIINDKPYHSEEMYDDGGNIIDERPILVDGEMVPKHKCICCAYGPSECICGAWDEPLPV